MEILDLLSHGFIQRALIAGVFIAILCSALGVFLVLRNLSYIGDGLSHVAFGGVAQAVAGVDVGQQTDVHINLTGLELVAAVQVGFE